MLTDGAGQPSSPVPYIQIKYWNSKMVNHISLDHQCTNNKNQVFPYASQHTCSHLPPSSSKSLSRSPAFRPFQLMHRQHLKAETSKSWYPEKSLQLQCWGSSLVSTSGWWYTYPLKISIKWDDSSQCMERRRSKKKGSKPPTRHVYNNKLTWHSGAKVIRCGCWTIGIYWNCCWHQEIPHHLE